MNAPVTGIKPTFPQIAGDAYSGLEQSQLRFNEIEQLIGVALNRIEPDHEVFKILEVVRSVAQGAHNEADLAREDLLEGIGRQADAEKAGASSSSTQAAPLLALNAQYVIAPGAQPHQLLADAVDVLHSIRELLGALEVDEEVIGSRSAVRGIRQLASMAVSQLEAASTLTAPANAPP